MRQHLTRLTRSALFSACVILPLAGVGCEKSESVEDRKVEQAVKEGQTLALAGQLGQGTAKLQEAAQSSGASNAAKATAQASLGAAKYDQAMRLVSVLPKYDASGAADASKLGLGQQEERALRLMDEIEGIASRITVNNMESASMALSDPSRQAAAGGGAEGGSTLGQMNKIKADHQKASEAAAAAMKQAQGKITDLTGQINDLQKKANAANKQATDLLDQSEHAKGEDSVKLFNQSTDLRKQAEDLNYKVGQLQQQVKQQQTALAEQEGIKKLWDDAVAADEKGIAAVTQLWTSTQTSMEARKSDSQALARQDLAQKAKALGDVLASAAQTREQIMKLLEESANAYKQAGSAAAQVTVAMVDLLRGDTEHKSPSRPAWERMQALYNKGTYAMGEARARVAEGTIQLQERSLLQAQQRTLASLQSALTPAGISAPAELGAADLPKRIEELTAKARENFTAAITLTGAADSGVVEGNGPELPTASEINFAAQYGLSVVEPGAKGNAALTKARKQLKEIVSPQNPGGGLPMLMPKLPDNVEQGAVSRPQVNVPIPATTPRTSAPTTQPTAQPETTGGNPSGGNPSGGSIWGSLLKKTAQSFTNPSGTTPTPPEPNK